MTIIIGLLGPAGAGKTTVAAHLEKHYGARRYSLAGPLKDIARRVLGFSHEQLYGTQEQKETDDPRYGFSARWFLQKLGTEGCRAVLGDDVWTRACLLAIERDAPAVAVIEDVRFKNEADAIVETGGFVWRLCPPGDAETATRAAAAGRHASETEWRDAYASVEYVPAERGLESLFGFADAACQICGVEKTS